MKTLVTGGGGFLGKALVKKLLSQGHTVRSFSRGDYPELRELGVEELHFDPSFDPSVGSVQGFLDTIELARELAG